MSSESQSILRSILLPIYVPTLILSICQGLLIPVLPLYAREEFALSYALVGLVLAAEGLGMLAGDLPAGSLLGWMGRKYAMLIGIGGMALGTLAFTWASTVVELVAYGAVVGLTGALWNIARHAYLADAVPTASRGRAIATFGGINRIGLFIGPLVGGFVGEFFGLRAPFLLYALLAVTALVFPLRFVTRGAIPRRSGVRGHSLELWSVLRAHYRVLAAAGTGSLFAQTIRSGRKIIVPLYAADIIGLDVGAVGLIVGLAAAVDMSLFYPAGYVMDHFGRKFSYVPSFLLQALGMALIPLTGSFTALLLASCLIGFGNGLGSGTMMTLGADLAPSSAMGEFLGVWRLIGDVGQSSGPLVVGALANVLGLALSIFAIAGVGLLAAATLGLLVPETLRKEQA